MPRSAKEHEATVSILQRLERLAKHIDALGPNPLPHLRRLAITELALPKGGFHGSAGADPGGDAAQKLDDSIGDVVDLLDSQQAGQPGAPESDVPPSGSPPATKPKPGPPGTNKPIPRLPGTNCQALYQAYIAAVNSKDYALADQRYDAYEKCLHQR